jgi:hypothetical protein
MKAADIGGFGAILAGGYIIGRDTQRNDFTPTDLLLILVFLAVGFYLAVVLS